MEGRLELIEGFPSGVNLTFGASAVGLEHPIRLYVHDPRFYRQIAFRGSLGAAEAYVDGLWSADQPAQLVQLFVRNRAVLQGANGALSRIARGFEAVAGLRFVNTRRGSRRNIHAHYDLGNEFFREFLDPTMTYSSAVFERQDASLEQAQVAKLDRLCKMLRLQPNEHLLEIGTGWGSMAIHAASRFGCRVTTTTISEEQHALATERVRAAGLQDRVRVLFEDYRDLTGVYDKLVSVEMIEAVGAAHLDEYLRVCSDRLATNGAMALQAITIEDQDFDRAARAVDFIKRYVFPGCFIPSVTAILRSATRSTDLRLRYSEDFGPDYAKTLRIWRDRFLAREAAVSELGYDERFRRLWDWYLCYCEGAFQERYLGVNHMLFTKPHHQGTVRAVPSRL